jgi:serine/threonine protein kinase
VHASIYVLVFRHVGKVCLYTWNCKDVAVKKFFVPEIDKEAVDFVLAEVHAHQSLHHPNIVKFYGMFFEPPIALGFVMEYCERGSLYDYLHDPASPLRRTRQVYPKVLVSMARSIAVAMAVRI